MHASLVALLAAASIGATPAAPVRRVAVLDFNARWASGCATAQTDAQQERCEMLRLFADQARGGALAVLRPPAFVVMTRENTAQILKDMGGQCSEGECEVETARLLGASVVVSGEVSFMEGTWLVSLKVHDVASAALLGTGDTRGKSKLEAFDNVRAETERMLRAATLEVAGAGAVSRDAEAKAAETRAAKEAAGREAAAKKAAEREAAERDAAARKAAERAAEVAAAERRAAEQEAKETAEREAERSRGRWDDWRDRPWSAEVRLGSARVGGIDLDPPVNQYPTLFQVHVQGGYRLTRDVAIHAGLFYFGDGTATTSDDLRLDWKGSAGLVAGAAWIPFGNRWVSLAAEVGFANAGVALVSSLGKDSAEASYPLLGFEVRGDWSFAEAWYLGARGKVTLMPSGLEARVVRVAGDGFLNSSTLTFLQLSAAAGYRF